MSDSKAKMHKIRFRLRLQPVPCRGAYSAPPDTLAEFKGPTSKGGRGGKGEKGRKGEKRRGQVRGQEKCTSPIPNSWIRLCSK